MLRTAPATSRLRHGYVFIMSKETHGTLRLQGYFDKSIWECEWECGQAALPTIQIFRQWHQTLQPLDPKDAFFTPDEEIMFKSLSLAMFFKFE